NEDPLDPANPAYFDPYDPYCHRLIAQDGGAGHGIDAKIDRLLGPGTYYLAISGSGNRYFCPFIADSGTFGSSGDYGLLVTATDLPQIVGPSVLTVDPANSSVLDRSPMIIRVDLSGAINPATINYDPTAPDATVQLRYNQTGIFSQGSYQTIT